MVKISYFSFPDHKTSDRSLAADESLTLLNAYLFSQENTSGDITKMKGVLEMDPLIFEIGCGSGEAAWEIAKNNPHTGVIAIDKYDWTVPVRQGSHYQRTALAWREKRLQAQLHTPVNLVVLRAEFDIIRYFPDHCIDTVLMINPEPKVCEVFLRLMGEKKWFNKIKPGPSQILVVPFSREMGVSACGGFECDYSGDRPGNLGFLFAPPFRFHRGENMHWGLDLSRASAYSRNSTRNEVFVYGNQYPSKPLSAWHNMLKKFLCISIPAGP